MSLVTFTHPGDETRWDRLIMRFITRVILLPGKFLFVDPIQPSGASRSRRDYKYSLKIPPGNNVDLKFVSL
jgi:hypothetical protein